MGHAFTEQYVIDWLGEQEPISTDGGSDRDSISDMNIADDTDSDDTMTEESMDGSIVQRVGGNDHTNYAIQNGEFMAEVDVSTIRSLLSSRGGIHTPSSGGSSDDDSSAMTDVESEDRDRSHITGMRNKHLDNTQPQLVSTTLDHHRLQFRDDKQPVTAAVTTSASSTFPNRQRYGICPSGRLTLQE